MTALSQAPASRPHALVGGRWRQWSAELRLFARFMALMAVSSNGWLASQ